VRADDGVQAAQRALAASILVTQCDGVVGRKAGFRGAARGLSGRLAGLPEVTVWLIEVLADAARPAVRCRLVPDGVRPMGTYAPRAALVRSRLRAPGLR
jgi:hypothetical protein